MTIVSKVYWSGYGPDSPIEIWRMSNKILTAALRNLETESASILGTMGEEMPGNNPLHWMLGESVAFHPITRFPEYLGLANEVLKRHLEGEFKPYQVRHWRELLRRFPP